ncbi:MAG: hypothetical protein QM770_02815 [Tepidisphaeraceae bacterium]
MLAEGEAEAVFKRKSESYQSNVETLQRALDAANEVLSRKEGVDARTRGNAAFLKGFFLEDLGGLDRQTQAVHAYLDFVDAYKDNADAVTRERATNALDNAQLLVAALRKQDRTNAGVVAAYERLLPTALAKPFERNQFAFLWAYHLQYTLQKPADAVAFYRLVPNTDANYDASQYFMLVALAAQLDTLKAGNTSAEPIVVEMNRLSDVVLKNSQRVQASADADQKAVWRSRVANATVIRADLQLNHLKDAKAALKTLDDFESFVEGVPGSDSLSGEALFLRVQSLMATGDSDSATKQLVTLLEKGGGRGIRLVSTMLERLERDFTDAEVAGDRVRMSTLQNNRATLTSYLLQWAEKTNDDAYRKYLYAMRVSEAETQRLAADLDPDDAKRKERFSQVRTRFESLDHKTGTKPWVRTNGSLEPGDTQYDPFVRLSLARIDFELGDFKAARDAFNALIRNQALGGPFVTVNAAGTDPVQRDNDVFWEAHYKLFASRLKLGDNPEATKLDLRGLSIRFGDTLGGRKWHDKLRELQEQVDPGWKPPATSQPAGM